VARLTRVIKFRVEREIYDFLKDFADSNKMSLSEVMRSIIIYHLMFIAVNNPIPMSKLREMFMKKYSSKDEDSKNE